LFSFVILNYFYKQLQKVEWSHSRRICLAETGIIPGQLYRGDFLNNFIVGVRFLRPRLASLQSNSKSKSNKSK